MLAALDSVNGVDADNLTGSIVVTATANPLAFDAREKGAPQDGYDLDQTFPGRSNGFITERMAATLFEEVGSTASLHDQHAHEQPGLRKKALRRLQASARSIDVGARVAAIHRLLPAVGGMPDGYKPDQGELLGDISGALDYQLLGRGTPAFMIELGGGSRAEAHYIEQGVKGMQGVARMRGVLPAVPTQQGPQPDQSVTLRTAGRSVRAPGLHSPAEFPHGLSLCTRFRLRVGYPRTSSSTGAQDWHRAWPAHRAWRARSGPLPRSAPADRPADRPPRGWPARGSSGRRW